MRSSGSGTRKCYRCQKVTELQRLGEAGGWIFSRVSDRGYEDLVKGRPSISGRSSDWLWHPRTRTSALLAVHKSALGNQRLLASLHVVSAAAGREEERRALIQAGFYLSHILTLEVGIAGHRIMRPALRCPPFSHRMGRLTQRRLAFRHNPDRERRCYL